MNKGLLILAGILAVAVIILAAFYFVGPKNPQVTIQEKPDVNTKTVKKVDLPESQVSSLFSTDLPVEAGSYTLQRYEAVSQEGNKQATLIFSTKKTLAAAIKTYQTYFVAKGWEETPVTNKESGILTSLFKKNQDLLVITARTDTQTKENSIELTLTKNGN